MKEVVDFITGLGSTVVLPIIIFLLALLFGAKPARALRSGLTIGIGFVGLGLVITLLMTNLGPATDALIKRTGIQLTAMDVGWPVAAAIAFGTTIGAIIVPVAFAYNVLLLFLRGTKTLNVDIWNFWHFAFTGSLVYIITDNVVIGVIAALFHETLTLLIADLTAKRVQEFFKLPGISIPQGWAVTSVPVVWVVDKIIDRIPGLRDVKADPDTIQKRLGVIGDPLILGLIMGVLMSLLAGYDFTQTAQLAVALAAVMLLMPRIISIFMEGLIPFSEAARNFLKKRFSGREVYIGLDSAIMIGHPVTIAAAVLLIPTVLFLAAILPGNKTLPFADLAATAFFVAFATPLMRGNLVRTFIAGVCILVMVLYLSTALAPQITDTASSIGYALPEAAKNASQITALSGGNLFAWLGVQAAQWTSWIGPIVLLLAALAALFYVNVFRKPAPEAPEAPEALEAPEGPEVIEAPRPQTTEIPTTPAATGIS
jgi:PTS system galactitol-specific IIC component